MDPGTRALLLGLGALLGYIVSLGIPLVWVATRRSALRRRWERGMGLSLGTLALLGLVWGVPYAVGHFVVGVEAIPEWVRYVFDWLWMAAALAFCPLAFNWLAQKFPIAAVAKEESGAQGAAAGPGRLSGPASFPGEPVTPADRPRD
jgi:hypothetical protein